MAALNITKQNFEQEVLHSDKKVLIDFWAAWCGPCRRVSPVIEEIADERPDIKVCKVNVDEQPELAAQFQDHEHSGAGGHGAWDRLSISLWEPDRRRRSLVYCN